MSPRAAAGAGSRGEDGFLRTFPAIVKVECLGMYGNRCSDPLLCCGDERFLLRPKSCSRYREDALRCKKPKNNLSSFSMMAQLLYNRIQEHDSVPGPEVLCAYVGSILVILEGEYEPPDKF
ncbi:hypothetical protein D4764_04G0004190 [Takifugu flavidus]|uniref:Uncharacterized protein n=1 Tax=Takifugu flavidus TaxID=433684 RepID=A0A5C6N2Q6_9TELE|nr:hypothetical protein D4764_04G0004190 [Takifugu flavidus]